MIPWIPLLAACSHPEAAPVERPPPTDRVRFASSQPASELPVATLPAEVLPAPGAVHALGPGFEGRLLRWHVAPGDPVETGAPLATLVSPALVALEARSAELQAAVGQRREQLALREAAAARGVASASDVEAARAVLTEAIAAQAAVGRDLRALRDSTTRDGDAWTWRAPVSGTVGTLSCALGSIPADATCLTLVHPEGVVLEVDVPERLLTLLEPRSRASFLAADGRSWTFDELARSPTLDPVLRSQVFRYAVVTDTPPLPGASGRARIQVPAAPDVRIVPSASITRIDGAPTLFVDHPDGPRPHPVTVLAHDNEQSWVAGLGPDDRIAVSGVFLLKSLALLEQG